MIDQPTDRISNFNQIMQVVSIIIQWNLFTQLAMHLRLSVWLRVHQVQNEFMANKTSIYAECKSSRLS